MSAQAGCCSFISIFRTSQRFIWVVVPEIRSFQTSFCPIAQQLRMSKSCSPSKLPFPLVWEFPPKKIHQNCHWWWSQWSHHLPHQNRSKKLSRLLGRAAPQQLCADTLFCCSTSTTVLVCLGAYDAVSGLHKMGKLFQNQRTPLSDLY